MKLTQAVRKHRLGAARIAHVISTCQPTVGVRLSGEPEYCWIGDDDRGLELEIIGVIVATDSEPTMLIIHAMPTALRRK
nr:hypothetical protein [Propionibacterium sp.]